MEIRNIAIMILNLAREIRSIHPSQHPSPHVPLLLLLPLKGRG